MSNQIVTKMDKVYSLSRLTLRRNFLYSNSRIAVQFSTAGSDDEKKKIVFEKKSPAEQSEAKQRSEQALNKLNDLLKKMVNEEVKPSGRKIELARPKRRPKAPKEEPEAEATSETKDKNIFKAVKNVAAIVGGDVKHTESELIAKLLKLSDRKDTAPTALSDIVKGMEVDHEKDRSRAQQVRQALKTDELGPKQRFTRRHAPEIVSKKIDLFGGEPLGIFTTNQPNTTEGVENTTWNQLYARELKLAVTHPPANYFQKMILWTEQGKIWKFPIDNEQGLEQEQSIHFAEHIFLERHLESWCPPRGPLRHFMELVCVGLSKNPHITVEDKKAHIEWFRTYFEDKKKLLQEVGAMQEDTPSAKPKQIE